MASSVTMTVSFFGGAVAAKPAAATTGRSQLAVRASMDFEKAVEKSNNTRRGVMLAAAGSEAVSSVAKVAIAADKILVTPDLKALTPDLKALTPIDPSTLDIITFARFTVSEYNKKILASEPDNLEPKLLTFVSVLKADKWENLSGFYRIEISAREGLGPPKKYIATVLSLDEPGTVIFTILES